MTTSKHFLSSDPDLTMDDLKMPHVQPRMRVGLFGGSFNPPHDGHCLVAETALSRLELDQLWWIVTPGNPLKNSDELLPLSARIQKSRDIYPHPKVKVTAFEALYDVRFTADMLRIVLSRNTSVDFVWVMGADNLAQFHKWQHWRAIAQSVPLAIVDRPGSTLSYMSAPAAITLRQFRVDESDASGLPKGPTPAWTFLHGPRSSLSSSAIRGKGASDKDMS